MKNTAMQNQTHQSTIKPVAIGPYVLDTPVVLAPMAGVADAPFREVCRQFGASLSTSEMLTSDIGLWHQQKSQWRLKWAANEKPVSVQIAGTDPELMAEAARQCQKLGAQIIDINMGCPAKKVCKKSAGSALMAQESLAYSIIKRVVEAVDCPIMVKTRTGTDHNTLNAVQIAQLAESAGAQAIAIHGRTRACQFKGTAEHRSVKAVKLAISIPVFANGDIKSAKEAKCVLDETAVDGIMIGRGALGQPWLFRQINEYLAQGQITTELSFVQKWSVINQHLCKIHEFYGPIVGVRLARKHISWYLQHLPSPNEFSKEFMLLKTCDQQRQLIDHLFENLAKERCS